MCALSDIHYSLMQLLAECGWVSRPLIDLVGYSYTYQTRSLKLLLDEQYIRKQGEGRYKCYALAVKGRNHLAAYNACRFRAEVMELTNQLSRHPERAMLRGNAAAMLSFAGFAVHPDDKPPLPALMPLLPENPTHADWRRLYQNSEQISYGQEVDKRVYIQRQTAIGCYYDATLLKSLIDGDKDNEGVNYSRACGVLITPFRLLRVYHSRDVAMKFRIAGERNFRTLLRTELVFSGQLPEEQDGVLIFGDDFTAAVRTLEHHLYGYSSKLPAYVRRSGNKKGYREVKGTVGEMLTPTNLGNPAFYLPLRAESLELLRMMQFPFWQERFVQEVNKELFDTAGHTRWCFEQEGQMVFILAALNLVQIDIAFRSIRSTATQKVRIICLHWQEDFFRQLLEPYIGKRSIRLTKLPPEYVAELLERLEQEWG